MNEILLKNLKPTSSKTKSAAPENPAARMQKSSEERSKVKEEEEGGGVLWWWSTEKRCDWRREGASARPGDPTRSALKAGRWQLSILPHPPQRSEAEEPGAKRSGHPEDIISENHRASPNNEPPTADFREGDLKAASGNIGLVTHREERGKKFAATLLLFQSSTVTFVLLQQLLSSGFLI